MCTLTVHIREYFIAFPQDNNDFYGKKRNPSDKLYFSEKTNYPSLISSPPPPPPKLKHKLHNSNKLTENNTQPPNKLLQKFSLKKNPLTKITTQTNFRCY